jgi:hypothetical protein
MGDDGNSAYLRLQRAPVTLAVFETMLGREDLGHETDAFQEYVAPYHGILLGGGPNWDRKISFYRYHIEDPVMFDTSCRVTIKHGHANRRNDDWSSTAYWYQTEPHLPFPLLRPASERLPTVKSWETEYQVPISIVTFDGRIGTPAVVPPQTDA